MTRMADYLEPHPEWVCLQPQTTHRAVACSACGHPLASAGGVRLLCDCEHERGLLLHPETVEEVEEVARG